jgi:uncharacterized protein YndB with AHSA1/START domain
VDQVVQERFVDAPPETVFAMFVDPRLLVRWIAAATDLDPRPGGVFRLTLAGGDVCSGRYLEVEPPRRVVFTWGWETTQVVAVLPGASTVEVELTPDGSGTHLRLVHTGLEGDAVLLHEHAWRRFLDRLEAVGEGRNAGPGQKGA